VKRRFEHRHTIIEEIQDKPKRYGCLLIIALISLVGGALKFGAVILDLAQPYLKLPLVSPAPGKGSSSSITLADGRRLALVETESLHLSTQQAIKDVAASEKNGFVAVGWHEADGNKNAAVWWSPNGQRWSRVSDGGRGFEGSGDQYLLAVTSHGDGFVAVGSDKGQAAVYDSPDGRQWFRLRNRDGVFSDGGGQFMSGITSHGELLVAVGARRDQRSGTLMPAAWFRRGSAPWERAVTGSPPPSAAGTSEEVQIRDVIATPSRYVAAGSISTPGDGRERPTLWTSETGARWQSVAGSTKEVRGIG
jgi:hypothetical protein